MTQHIVGSSLLFFASCAAFAQTAASPLSFEVASVKPAVPSSDDRVIRRMQGGPGSTDPGRISYSNFTLKLLATIAYNLKNYQVEGPEWIDSLGYDIEAKLPPNTTREQLASMLQTLLAERFKIAIHRETRQIPIFALVAAKGGPKLQETGPAAPGAGKMGGPGIRIEQGPNGMRMAGSMTMDQLANQLTRVMERPVLDQTELTATYNVDMTWMPDEMDGGGRGPHNADAPVLTLPQALQEKLGLKLDPRKSSAEILIVDRAERVPVEN